VDPETNSLTSLTMRVPLLSVNHLTGQISGQMLQWTGEELTHNSTFLAEFGSTLVIYSVGSTGMCQAWNVSDVQCPIRTNCVSNDATFKRSVTLGQASFDVWQTSMSNQDTYDFSMINERYVTSADCVTVLDSFTEQVGSVAYTGHTMISDVSRGIQNPVRTFQIPSACQDPTTTVWISTTVDQIENNIIQLIASFAGGQ
jgi:hypothetical protein